MLPATAKEAYKTGSKFYFNGKPCLRGHIAPRYESMCRCVACIEEDKGKRKKPEPRTPEQKATRAKAAARRRKHDEVAAFTHAVRTNVGRAFDRKGLKKNAKTENLLGCTIAEFRSHIERQFLPGMTWENRSEWHIDHIVALATANTTDAVAKLCHHTNLRPIWKSDNLKKAGKATHLI